MWHDKGGMRSKKLLVTALVIANARFTNGSRYIGTTRKHPSLSVDKILLTSIRGGSSTNDDDDVPQTPPPPAQEQTESEDTTIIKEESSDEDIEEVNSLESGEEVVSSNASSKEVEIEESTTVTGVDNEVSSSTTNPPSEIIPKKTKSFPLSASAIERTGGAIIALIALSTILSIFGSNGIIGLCLLSQLAMFKEVYSVVGVTNTSKFQKWLCFATIQCFTSLHALSVTNHPLITCIFPSSTSIQWLGYSLAIITLLSSVLSMEFSAQKHPQRPSSDIFKSHLGDLVSTIFMLLFLLGQSTFWICTLNLTNDSANANYGLQCILHSVILVIINDTMAYICGKTFGKTPLLPNLSPNKTIEGFIGAAFFTILSSAYLWNVIIGDTTTTKSTSVILALFASFIAPFGGFLASAVKRSFGAKDFGTLIPGHGGVMDRLDCHLIMAPFTYMYLKKLQP